MNVFNVQFTIFDARTHSWFSSKCSRVNAPHVLIVSRGTQAISRENVHAWSRLAIVNVTGRARLLLLNACAPEHTRRHTTCFDHLAGRKRAESVLHMRRHVLVGRSFAVCTTTTGNCTCSFDSCCTDRSILGKNVWREKERERDSVFRERKKGDTCEIEYAKKNVWSNRRILVLLVLSILSMDIIKNKK